eukprot:15219689-Ditylum_brightwellii.AAC.1
MVRKARATHLHGRNPGAPCVHLSKAQQGLDVNDLEVVAEEVVSRDYDFLVRKSHDMRQDITAHNKRSILSTDLRKYNTGSTYLVGQGCGL